MATLSISKVMTGSKLVPGYAVHADSARHLDCDHSASPQGPVSDALGNPLNNTQYPAFVSRCQSTEAKMVPYDLETYLTRDQVMAAYLREGDNSSGHDVHNTQHMANMQHNMGLQKARTTSVRGQEQINSFLSTDVVPVFHT